MWNWIGEDTIGSLFLLMLIYELVLNVYNAMDLEKGLVIM
jgi:hypothetical protein